MEWRNRQWHWALNAEGTLKWKYNFPNNQFTYGALAIDSNGIAHTYSGGNGGGGIRNNNGTLTASPVSGVDQRGTTRPQGTTCDIGAFETTQFTLAVSTPTGGTITSGDSRINCGTNGSACSASYVSGSSVTLTAAASSGYSFSGWGGACSGTGTTCALTMVPIEPSARLSRCSW